MIAPEHLAISTSICKSTSLGVDAAVTYAAIEVLAADDLNAIIDADESGVRQIAGLCPERLSAAMTAMLSAGFNRRGWALVPNGLTTLALLSEGASTP